MIDILLPHIQDFDTLSLDELNAKAAMLDREENKYLVTSQQFIKMLDDLKESFDILKIEDNLTFDYKSIYFDTDDLLGYSHHNKGKTKRRFKVRTRHYVDSDMCFFEVKLKNKRGGTIKKRIPYEIDGYGKINEIAQDFLKKSYKEVYGREFRHNLDSKLEVNYTRMTLVAKEGGERMTIDFNLTFAANNAETPVKTFLICETKSSNGKGLADKVFKQHQIKSRSCSKYMLGANLLKLTDKYNNFKPLLKLYNKLPLYKTA